MVTVIKDKKELMDLASDFSGFVKKHNWVSRYDIESDALSITTNKLSKDARIRYFDDEIAFYITKDKNLEGIFVEYFESNFIKHHKGLNDILKDIRKRKEIKDEGKTLVDLSQSKIEKIAPRLEDVLRSSLAEKINLSFQS